MPASPSWFTGITAGTWGTLPSSVLTGSGVDESGVNAIVAAWGGACLNTDGVYIGTTFTSGTFLCLFGGGHTDSTLNSVYAYGPLESSSPAWHRLRDTTSPAITNVDQDASGHPVSRHTYSCFVYLPSPKGWLFCTGGLFRATDAAGVIETHVFDFTVSNPNVNNPWTKKVNTGVVANSDVADTSVYDSVRNVIWSHQDAANAVQFYDVASNAFTADIFKSPGWSTNPASAFDTSRSIWAVYAAGVLNFYDARSGTANDYYAPTTTGTAPTGDGSVIYDAVDDAFFFWNGGGKKIFKLAPPATLPYQGGNAWTWTNFTPGTGSTPTGQAGTNASFSPETGTSTGTYGRWAYVPGTAIRGYLLMNRTEDSIYFYRPSDSAGVTGGGPSMLPLLGAG
jgi:hypothetical protein